MRGESEMKIGYDNKQQELRIGDICKFTFEKQEYVGMVMYDDQDYCHYFEMLDNSFPALHMMMADLGSIEKMVNVWNTKIGDEYKKFRELCVGKEEDLKKLSERS